MKKAGAGFQFISEVETDLEPFAGRNAAIRLRTSFCSCPGWRRARRLRR
jgi:hypothetical protein